MYRYGIDHSVAVSLDINFIENTVNLWVNLSVELYSDVSLYTLGVKVIKNHLKMYNLYQVGLTLTIPWCHQMLGLKKLCVCYISMITRLYGHASPLRAREQNLYSQGSWYENLNVFNNPMFFKKLEWSRVKGGLFIR